MKIKLICFLTLIISSFCSPLLAQEDKTVTLTVSGQGKTKDEAKDKALRNAIEQAFGAFISTRTEILNDQLVSDQIISVASGNIRSFEILNETLIPTGGFVTTLKARVSVAKLTSFVESKGISVEVKGGLFALNIKQQILNEKNEFKIIYEMVGMLHETLQQSFDYEISSGQIKSIDGNSDKWEIPLIIGVKANQNMDFCSNYIYNIVDAISLKESEIEYYNSINKNIYDITLNINGQEKLYYLRQKNSLNAISVLLEKWRFYSMLFVVHSGNDSLINIGQARIEPLGKIESYNSKFALKLKFPESGQSITSFVHNDIKTLKQLEQLSEYTINPRGVVLPIKFGGFVVYEENGHGLIKSICIMEKYKWSFAKVETEELDLFGNVDWILPSAEDLEKIVNSYQTRFWTENQFEWLLWSDGFAGNPIKGTCEDNCEGILQPVYRF